jgi:hypothetical protein
MMIWPQRCLRQCRRRISGVSDTTDASNGESHHDYLKLTVSFQAALIQRRCKLWTYKPLHG